MNVCTCFVWVCIALDPAVVEVSKTLLKDSKMVAKYLKDLQVRYQCSFTSSTVVHAIIIYPLPRHL